MARITATMSAASPLSACAAKASQSSRGHRGPFPPQQREALVAHRHGQVAPQPLLRRVPQPLQMSDKVEKGVVDRVLRPLLPLPDTGGPAPASGGNTAHRPSGATPFPRVPPPEQGTWSARFHLLPPASGRGVLRFPQRLKARFCYSRGAPFGVFRQFAQIYRVFLCKLPPVVSSKSHTFSSFYLSLFRL